jgi:hypothetical protein
MAEIELLRRDGTVAAVTLVDDADAAWLGQWIWRLSTRGRAYRSTMVDGKMVTLYLSRVIMGAECGGAEDQRRADGTQVDHVNGDVLDNRRANLRLVAPSGNRQNVRRTWGTSQHRGVHWDARRKKWRATVARRTIGRFESEADAARAAADYRRKHYPLSTV